MRYYDRMDRIRNLKHQDRIQPPESEHEVPKPELSPDDVIEAVGDDEELKRLLEASVCKESFFEFFKRFWSTIIPEDLILNWHIKYICDQMQAVAERVFKGEANLHDLVINISPGTSKSTICSVMFPAWVWTRMPSARLLCCSFSEKLSLRLSRYCRDVIKSPEYRNLFPDVQIKKDYDTKGEFANTHKGVRFAVGSGTQVMGSHSHFIIVDDPIDPEGVLSEAELRRINNWIAEQLSGRKVNKLVSVTIMVAQRLHQSDPPAIMSKKKGVKTIKIPATDEYEIKPKSLKRYYVNGLFDPVRLPQSALDKIKAGERGSYVMAGQYGQNPVPPGGGMFKVKRANLIPSYQSSPKFKLVVRFWDKAGTLGGGAYTVGVLMGITHENRIWVLDVIRCQVDSFERERLIRQTARMDGKSVWVGIEQSGGEGGKESAENTVRRLIGWRVKVLRPGRGAKGTRGTGKEERAEPLSTQMNAGNIYVYDKDWTQAYLDEFSYFPFGTFKDQVDASAGALTVLTTGRREVGGMQRGTAAYQSNDPQVINRRRHLRDRVMKYGRLAA